MRRALLSLFALSLGSPAVAGSCDRIDEWLERGFSTEYVRRALEARQDRVGLACLAERIEQYGDVAGAGALRSELALTSQDLPAAPPDCSLETSWMRQGLPRELAEKRAPLTADPARTLDCVQRVYAHAPQVREIAAAPMHPGVRETRQLGSALVGVGAGGLLLTGVAVAATAGHNLGTSTEGSPAEALECVGSVGFGCNQRGARSMVGPAILGAVFAATTVTGIGLHISVAGQTADEGGVEVAFQGRF